MASIIPFKIKGNSCAPCELIEINGLMKALNEELAAIDREIGALKKRRRKVLCDYQKLVPTRARLIIAAGIIVATIASVINPVAAMEICAPTGHQQHYGDAQMACEIVEMSPPPILD